MDMFEIETNTRKLIIELIQPLLDKLQVERENIIKTKKIINGHKSRIEAIEATVFEEKADDQFSEIRQKILDMKIEEQKNLAEIEEKIENRKKEYEEIGFNFTNMQTEFDGIKSTCSLLKENMKGLETRIMEEIEQTNAEVEGCNKRTNDSFKELNDRQAKLDEELAQRFKQLDVQKVMISKVSALQAVTALKCNHIKDLCIKLEADKVNFKTFLAHVGVYEEVTRRIKINHDKLSNKLVAAENFTDKYVPIMAQNVVCDTLTQIVNSKERKRLEVYEHKVYLQLHETLLKDEGSPDLDGHRDNILNQISNKLEILTKIINERKLLKPKPKDGEKKSEGAKPAPKSINNKSEVIKRVEMDEHGNLQMKEFSNALSPEEQKQQQKQEEAQRAIREMEANKGKLNYHKISERELDEVASIESSNIDYVEIFGERLDQVDHEIQCMYIKMNDIHEIISKTDKNLRDVNNKSVAEVQEYCFTLHHEMENLQDKIKKQVNPGIFMNEDAIRKLVKCKCKCANSKKSETKRSMVRNQLNSSMFLPNKELNDNLKLNPSNSNPVSVQIETPNPSDKPRMNIELNLVTKRKERKPIKIDEFNNSSMKKLEGEGIMANSRLKGIKNTSRSTSRQEDGSFPNIRKKLLIQEIKLDHRIPNTKKHKISHNSIARQRISTDLTNSSVYNSMQFQKNSPSCLSKRKEDIYN
ncbi:unnamed protein product [Moneuplotes crassus]|uniref:Uncharacterized protein n=1 Tax=Euplotes crassus TaxID=5936 RepID=A0AAD1Y8H2_EUPCR|nr:unnamed protein product [Moneuplotes crassus]